MKNMQRTLGFLLCTCIANLIYVACLFIMSAAHLGTDIKFTVLFLLVFSVIGGFVPALLLMSIPWVLTVWGYGKVRRWGAVYFSSVGAVLTLVLGCITSSLSPKPLFIEDQTFIEGVMVAAQRQGIPMLTAGAVFGIAYWLISERKK